MIGMLHGEKVDGYTFDCVVKTLMERPDLVQGFLSTRSGPSLHYGRNKMTEGFLAGDEKYLMSLDSDMTFTAGHIQALRDIAESKDLPIVAGIAWVVQTGKAGPDSLVANIWTQIGGKMEHPVQIPRNTLCQVGAVGAACVLIRRDVLEKVGHGWWDHILLPAEETESGKPELLGEDISFCKRVTEAGFPIHAHTGIEFGHVKQQIIDSSLVFGEEPPEPPDPKKTVVNPSFV